MCSTNHFLNWGSSFMCPRQSTLAQRRDAHFMAHHSPRCRRKPGARRMHGPDSHRVRLSRARVNSEKEEVWNDWESWLDYDSTVSPTTDCWGDILPLPLYANMLGVRPHNLDLLFRSTQGLLQRKHPFWMIYNSPFELCRKITASFVELSKTAENKNRIIAIILSCTNLFYFDMFLHLQKAPTRDERNAWARLAYHLSSQSLRALRIRVKWAKSKHLPISLTRSLEPVSAFHSIFYVIV